MEVGVNAHRKDNEMIKCGTDPAIPDEEYFTLDDIDSVIEVFDEFLKERGVRIPTSDQSMIEDGGYTKETLYENDTRIYGMDYGDLQMSLLELFEKLEKQGKVNNVVNSWGCEVEEWGNKE